MPDFFEKYANQENPQPVETKTPDYVGTFMQPDPSSAGQKDFFHQVALTPEKQNRSTFDVTAGAAEYGAADVAELLSKSVQRNLAPANNSLQDFSNSMRKFKSDNPQYSPMEVENTLDLISNPKALSSKIFGSAAYTGLMMGTAAIPAAGWVVTGLTSYGIESQRAYDSAIDFGATEQQAETAAKHTGIANAMFQVALSTKMLNVLKGEEGNLARGMAKSSNSIVRALGPTAELSKDAGILGAINAFQGAVDEKIALDTYGKPFDKDFWDKRLQEGTLGAVTSVLIGAPRTALRTAKIISNGEGVPVGEADINVFDRDSAYRYFKENGVPQDTAKSFAAIADSMASQFAVDTHQPKETFFPAVINDKNFELKTNGNALQSQIQTVFDSFDQDPATSVKTFLKNAVGQFPADKVDSLKKSIGVKDTTPPAEADAKLDGAFLRYLWEGEAPSPETAAPMEDLKQLLRDSYKNVTSLGAKKIGLETKIIFDSMLAPETDEITSTRRRIEAAKTEIGKNFPDQKDLLSSEEIQSLIEPIREEKVSHEFDSLLNVTKETKETTLRRPTTEELQKKMSDLLAQKETISDSEPLAMIEGVPRSKQEAALFMTDLYNDLDRMRMGRLQRDDLSSVEKRSESGGWLRDRLLQETPEDSQTRLNFLDRMKNGLDSARSFFDKQSPLRRWTNGQILLDTAQEVKTRSKLADDSFQKEITKRFSSLGWKERKWLQDRDSEGFTNLEKIIDQTLVNEKDELVPNPRKVEIPDAFQNAKDLRDFAWGMNKDYARQATRQGQLMRFSDGKWRPFQQPENQRFLRLHTDEFRKIVAKPNSPEWKGFLDYIKDLPGNENLAKMKTDELSKLAQRVYGDSELRTNSALEAARLFKIVPSEVPLPNGRKIKVFETDPLLYLQRASKVQADRLAWGSVVGQDVISNVDKSIVAKVAKIFGVEPRTDQEALIRRIRERVLKTPDEKLQSALDKSTTKGGAYGPANSAETVVENLLKNLRDSEKESRSQDVPDPLSDKKALANAVKIAKDLKINLAPSRQDFLDNINSITATNITAKQSKSLESAARLMEGVNTKLPPHELLSEIKSRLNEDTFAHAKTLLDRIDKESAGQATPHAERVLKDIQGIPTEMAVSSIPSIVRSVSSLLGTSMTALRAVLHVAQPSWQIAPDAGIFNYVKAMSDVLLHHGDIEGTKIIGAIPDVVHSWGMENLGSSRALGSLFSLESWAKGSRVFTNKVMGINAIMNFNNVVAGQAYRRFAQGLMNREVVGGKSKVTSSDMATLKGLGISSQEISQIQSGQMSKITFAKIVQNGVERLGSNLPAFKQGRLESSPIGRMLFNYSSYAINSGRLISSFMQNNIIPALKSRDPATMLRSGKDLFTFVGAALGAGALTEILYNIPRGQGMRDTLKKEDESTVKEAWGSLMKIAFVGPAARFIESLQFSGPQQWAIGMMPQLNAITKLVGLFDNEFNKAVYGQASEEQRYGRYSFARNVEEYLKSMNPVIREWGHTLDNAQYPDKPLYDESRSANQKYKSKLSKTISSPLPSAVDPMKDQIFFYVQRNDAKGAMTAAQDYYRDYVDQMSANPRQAMIEGMSPQKAIQSLRTSLENRSPIDLTENEKLDFLASLPQDRRVAYYQADLKYRALVDSVAPKERK